MKGGERVIIVFGLAGVGKSTLASRLAREFALRVVHPSGIMRDILAGRDVSPEESVANDGYWETPEGVRVLDSRLHHDKPVDLKADEILLQEVAKGGVVIDSWSLPWLTDRGVRIRLTAPLDVRATRAASRAGIDIEVAAKRIAKKDEDTRKLFLRLYGFDIGVDAPELFDLTLDTAERDIEEVFRASRDFVSQRWVEPN